MAPLPLLILLVAVASATDFSFGCMASWLPGSGASGTTKLRSDQFCATSNVLQLSFDVVVISCCDSCTLSVVGLNLSPGVAAPLSPIKGN